MTFGPELPPEEKQRRLAIVTRIGWVLLPAIFLFVAIVALAGDFLF
ncbi:hypothetical protein [Hansschlegelia zhihuaiae]|nr:hypothetical protein [Hansschlegelia zhihuaiae]